MRNLRQTLPSITIKDLVKVYQDEGRGLIRAVDNLSFECFSGEVFGLLGTNGAGKTTTLAILSTLLQPTSGMVEVMNYAKLVDFGQAAALGDQETRLGTYFYMAPDQAISALEKSSTSNVTWDIYSLAAAVYHLLTGSPPRYDRKVETSLSCATSFGEQLETYVKELRHSRLAPVRKSNPKCDPELAAIVEKCLSLEPQDRYQDMGQVLDDLERRKQKRPLRAMPFSPTYVLRLWFQRNVVLALFLVLSSAALSWTLWHWWAAYQEAEDGRRLAVEAKQNAESRLYDAFYQQALARVREDRSSGVFTRHDKLLWTSGSTVYSLVAQGKESKESFTFSGRLLLNRRDQDHVQFHRNELRVLDAEGEPDPRFEMLTKEGPYDKAFLSSKGDYLAAARDASVRIWSLKNRRPVTPWETYPATIKHIAFNTAENEIACALANNTIRRRHFGIDSDMPIEIQTLEIFHRSGWDVSDDFEVKFQGQNKEWRSRAAAHASKCQFPQENYFRQYQIQQLREAESAKTK